MNNETNEFKSSEEEQAAREFDAQQVADKAKDSLVDGAEIKSTVDTEKVSSDIESESVKLDRQINELFEEYPDLAKIGSKEEYKKYLETIFPDSKTQGIYYRGAGLGREAATKAGSNETVLVGAVFYTSSKYAATEYQKEINQIRKIETKVHTAKLDIERALEPSSARRVQGLIALERFLKEGNLSLENKNNFLIKLDDYKDVIEDMFGLHTKPEEASMSKHEISAAKEVYPRDKDRELAKAYLTYLQNHHRSIDPNYDNDTAMFFQGNYDGVIIPENSADKYRGAENYDQVAVLDPDQVHLLGSHQDIDKFAGFVYQEGKKE